MFEYTGFWKIIHYTIACILQYEKDPKTIFKKVDIDSFVSKRHNYILLNVLRDKILIYITSYFNTFRIHSKLRW